jgi:hypothetical protein
MVEWQLLLELNPHGSGCSCSVSIGMRVGMVAVVGEFFHGEPEILFKAAVGAGWKCPGKPCGL